MSPEKRTFNAPKGAVPTIAALLGLALLSLLFMPAADPGPSVGSRALDFRVTDLSGAAADLTAYRGKVLLLDFWATWCPNCLDEVPGLKALHEELGGEDFAILAVSIDEGGPDLVARFAAEYRMTYRVAFADESIIDDYRVSALPLKYLIDPDGLIIGKYLRNTDMAEVEADILASLRRRAS